MPPLIQIQTPSEISPGPEAVAQVVKRPISKRRGKKRSSRACTTCRQRKVRCNIVAHGSPCSNCRHDEIECILPLSRRQRSARERAEQSLKTSNFGSEIGDWQNVEDRNTTQLFQSIEPTHSASNLAPHGMRLPEHVLSEIFPAAPHHETIVPPQASMRTKSWIQIEAPLASAPIKRSEIPQTPDRRLPILPRVFIPFPRYLEAPDLSYLHSRDALTLPNEVLQIQLLKSYVEFIHGGMPLLDLEEFLSAVKYGYQNLDGQKGIGVERENANKKQISFLLFQAVMFAGVEYVSMGALKKAGYQTREDAQMVFFNRVRLLYDFDICADRLTIVQTLLLMTLCPQNTTHKDSKDAWHWLGLAVSLSFSLGINRNIPQLIPNMRQKRLERRIWWTAFVRDRILALNDSTSFVRPVGIKRGDCDVELLSLEDFELDDEEDVKVRRDAKECIEKVMLCWCSSDALVSNFSDNHLPPLPAPPSSIFIPQSKLISTLETDGALYMSTTVASEFDEQPSFFERSPIAEMEDEYGIASTSSSVHEDCMTPTEEELEPEKQVICSSPLGGGYGVDGEYDDYLEYLRPSIEKHSEKSSNLVLQKQQEMENRSTWAFQLDCENNQVLSV